MRLIAILFALIDIALLAPQADAQQLPTAHAGSYCSFGPYKMGAVGNVLPSLSEADKGSGPKSNEVNQIYRTFYAYQTASGTETGFAGWLTASFDGRFAFTPAGIPTAEKQLALWSLTVPNEASSTLPVDVWVQRLGKMSGAKADPAVSALLRPGRVLQTLLVPCFAHAWSGE